MPREHLTSESTEIVSQGDEERYRSAVENLGDIVYVVDTNGTAIYISPVVESVLGYSPSEITGQSFAGFIHQDDLPRSLEYFQKSLSGQATIGEYRLLNKAGEIRWVRSSNQPMLEDDSVIGATGVLSDITERRQAEERLKESEAKYSDVVENSRDGIVVLQDGLVQFVNSMSFELVGYTSEELVKVDFLKMVSPKEREVVSHRYLDRIAGKEVPSIYETVIIKKDGTELPVELNATVINYEGRPADLVFLRDITDRRQADEALRNSEEKYRNLVENSQDSIVIANIEGQVQFANEASETLTGYALSEGIGMNITEFVPTEYLEEVLMKLEEAKSGKPIPYFESAIRRKDGTVIPIETGGQAIIENGEAVGFQIITRSIAERKWAEEELRQSFNKLLRTSEGMIQAMAATIESRDPYTAGHQRRVAELANTIAKNMGLQENRVEGIRMAAIVHDIGKIYVPAEILSKPVQLTDVEFSLIRMHPQAGHDILKNIEFPWPVAEIVLGHHERLDGSGYPFGLRGDEISMEARILGVADVVEAISSYRPYRPAKGTNKALDEISKQSGILYDPAVVNACLNLFTEKRFRFSDETTVGTSQGHKSGTSSLQQ